MDEFNWIFLRATDRVNRSNTEVKRRTTPIEIVAGEHACHMFLMWFKSSDGTLLARS